ncbi:MAG: response regulator transcription factor [Nitrospira sp.]|nr:response regulator transcription factor [Nitrospira sp.]MDH4369476.1 response regulator transcription factor [Nitrospira sp.]MDH5347253.1 response regulator transcription factor [Nitrospira sp.]MDH5496400.1 response regulator transcription factor [Nitrospira sp.]MDH5724284.1 response regulator transcription factor [Nitrospira sp.]
MTRPRILMADDHSLVLAGLRRLVEDEGDVVGMVEDGRALVEEAQRLRPDLIFLDISMPLLNGLDAAKQLTKLVPDSKLIFLSMHATPTYVTEAFKVGAVGYLVKQSSAMELKQAIQTVLRGQHYMTPSVTKDMMGATLHHPSKGPGCKRPVNALAPRQREVLQLIAEGKSTRTIASMLHISIKTVEFHRTKIMEELNLHSIAELTRYAITEGLASL